MNRRLEPGFAGVEIGGTKIQIVSGDANGRIVQRERFSVDPARGADGIRRDIQIGLRRLQQRSRRLAVGVGFGGPLDRTGRVTKSHQVDGWDGFPLKSWLEEITEVPVAVENDANTAALGEALVGAGRGFSPVFYVTTGSGVGGGLVVNDAIYHGASGGEAEIGHLRLDKTGRIVEDSCSGWAVNKKIRHAMEQRPDTQLAKAAKDFKGAESKALPMGVEQNDPDAKAILEESADDLAFALSHVFQLFHPEAVILGGGLALLGEFWRAAVADRLPRYVMKALGPPPKVLLSGLGEDAVPLGALQLARVTAPRSAPHS